MADPIDVPIKGPFDPPPAPGGAAASDPFWPQVKALWNGDSFADATGRHTLVTVDGNPAIALGMLAYDGASSNNTTENVGDFQPPGPLTIDGQFVWGNNGQTQVMASTFDASTVGIEIYVRADGTFGIWSPTFFVESPIGAVAPNVLTDWAIVSDPTPGASEMRIYLNGARVAVLPGLPNWAGYANPLYLGREGAIGPKFFTGRQRMRWTWAIRYTGANYVPPAWPVPTQ